MSTLRSLSRLEHSHDDDRLTVGCPECIRVTRAAEKVARWAQAPLRTVSWTFTYYHPDGPTSLTFDLTVRVPDDATEAEVDEHYAGATGEAFIGALPESVPMDWTVTACETCESESLKIGPVVTPEVTPSPPAPSLFGPWGAVS